MSISDLLARAEGLTLEVVFSAAGHALTNAQIKAFANACAYQSAQQIEAALLAQLPPENERLSILLPLLVPGPARDFAHYSRLLVFYALACQGGMNGIDLVAAIERALEDNYTVGSAPYYAEGAGGGERGSKPGSGVSPSEAWVNTVAIDARRIFASTGLSGREIGTGVVGGSEVKGKNPAVSSAAVQLIGPGAGGFGSHAASRAAGSDARARQEAQSLEKDLDDAVSFDK